MIRNDYILKMIEQLARVLTQLLLNKQTLTHMEIETEFNSLSLRYTGLDYDFISNSRAEELVDLFSLGNELDYSKCFTAAHLCFEGAKISENTDKKEDSEEKYRKALTLYLECARYISDDLEKLLIEYIEILLHKITLSKISINNLKNLIQFYEQTGYYSKAENYLFELTGRDAAESKQYGISFYQRLLKKSDSELEKGNLLRQKVQDGMAALNDI